MATAWIESVSIRESIVSGVATWLAGLVLTVSVALLGLSEAIYILTYFDMVNGTIIGYVGLHTWFIDNVISAVWLTILPVGLLVLSGISLAPGTTGDPVTGFKHGATITAGYLPMAVVSIYFVSDFLAASGGTTHLLLSSAVTGIAFPVVFGGLGGALAESR
jgi:hypothetical protein